MSQNSNFRLTRNHRFFAINGIYSHATKTWWGHPRVHLGANGVLLGAKNGSKMYKITMPQNSNFRLPRGHRFCIKKMKVTVMALNQGGDPLGSISGPMGSHWVKKMGQNRIKNHAQKFEFSTTPRSSIYPKNGSYGYGAKSRWRTPRVHFGDNGVPLGPKHGSKP